MGRRCLFWCICGVCGVFYVICVGWGRVVMFDNYDFCCYVIVVIDVICVVLGLDYVVIEWLLRFLFIVRWVKMWFVDWYGNDGKVGWFWCYE